MLNSHSTISLRKNYRLLKMQRGPKFHSRAKLLNPIKLHNSERETSEPVFRCSDGSHKTKLDRFCKYELRWSVRKTVQLRIEPNLRSSPRINFGFKQNIFFLLRNPKLGFEIGARLSSWWPDFVSPELKSEPSRSKTKQDGATKNGRRENSPNSILAMT